MGVCYSMILSLVPEAMGRYLWLGLHGAVAMHVDAFFATTVPLFVLVFCLVFTYQQSQQASLSFKPGCPDGLRELVLSAVETMEAESHPERASNAPAS